MTSMDLLASAKQNITNITIADANQDFSYLIFLGVRDPVEFTVGNIPITVNNPHGKPEFQNGNQPDFSGQQAPDILDCIQSDRLPVFAGDYKTCLANGYYS